MSKQKVPTKLHKAKRIWSRETEYSCYWKYITNNWMQRITANIIDRTEPTILHPILKQVITSKWKRELVINVSWIIHQPKLHTCK